MPAREVQRLSRIIENSKHSGQSLRLDQATHQSQVDSRAVFTAGTRFFVAGVAIAATDKNVTARTSLCEALRHADDCIPLPTDCVVTARDGLRDEYAP